MFSRTAFHAALAATALAALGTAAGSQDRVAGAVPQCLIPNRGQWPAEVALQVRGAGATAWLVPDGIVLHLRRCEPRRPEVPHQGDGRPDPGAPAWADTALEASVRLTFVGGQASEIAGHEPLPGRVNLFLGDDPGRWKAELPTFAAAKYRDVWPGIACVVRTTQAGILAYDFHCDADATATPRGLCLRVDGAEGLELEPDGTLLVHTAVGDLRHSAPVAWQILRSGTRRPVHADVQLLDATSFTFRFDDLRAGLPLVVDPVLTFLGGSTDEHGLGVARDADGTLVVAGFTNSPDFPTTPGAWSTQPFGGRDVFVSRLDPSRSGAQQLVWATYIGGSLGDVPFDVALDVAGRITVTGYTVSTNFPSVNPIQPAHGGGQLDAFVTSLVPNGSQLLYSTYLGGAAQDWGCRVVVDDSLQATIAGCTMSSDFPVTTNAVQPSYAGLGDAFVSRLAPGGHALTWSTYHGGPNYEAFLWNNWSSWPANVREIGLDVDASGRVLLTGFSWGGGYPVTPNALQTAYRGGWDAFAAILDPSQQGAAQRVYSTYLGESADDGGLAARFAPRGQLLLAGYTYSTTFPTTTGAFQTSFVGPSPQYDDAFVCWVDPQAGQSGLVYSTLLGSGAYDAAMSIDVDARGHATVGGFCDSGFPTGSGWPAGSGGWQTTHGGAQDGWLARLRPEGRGRADLTYGTNLGGGANDAVLDFELDGLGGVVLAGITSSTDFPIPPSPPAPPPFQSNLYGASDAIAGHLELLPRNVARFRSGSSPHCDGLVILEVDREPTAGLAFEILVGNAPPTGTGVLAFGASPQTPCLPLLGAQLCLPLPLWVAQTVTVDPLGSLAVPLTAPASAQGLRFGIQTVWIDFRTCAGRSGPLASSPALASTLR